ncbi:hypothetical protein LCGC14_1244160 [marine sediment metagenome]|uniref:Uncharacterized protein n=1 Tax=marine sediment metagenome TaxID=412755 RepID=A0A0F9L506_9ZZZZ
MAFPSAFPPKREFIASFDFKDIASGLGYEVFYPKASKDASGTTRFLFTDSTLTSIPVTSSGTTITIFNFDTSVFNLPRTVKGTAYCVSRVSATSGTNAYSVQLVKVLDDLSTVNLSSEITSTTVGTSALDFPIQLPLTQTLIKKGEKIRLIFTLLKIDGGGVMTLENDGSQSPVYIPFEIPEP